MTWFCVWKGSILGLCAREVVFFSYKCGLPAPIKVVGHEILAFFERVLLLRILPHGRGYFVESREDERRGLGQLKLAVHFNMGIPTMPATSAHSEIGGSLGVGFIRHDETVETVGLEELLVHLLQKCLCTISRSDQINQRERL